MASFGACCFSGFVKTHNAKGELRKIGGESCYITPPNGNSADVILLCPDIFGIYPNSKLYADRLHEETGCTVVVADFFGGGPGVSLDVMLLMARVMGGEGYFFRNKSFFAGLWDMITTYAAFFSYVPSMISFMWRNGRNLEPKFVYVDNLLSGLVVERGMKRFVAAGYCFGAPFATRLGASSKWQGIVKGISPTHGQIPETDIANLKVPGHFACAEKDFVLPDKKRDELAVTLKNHPNAAARESDVKLYKARHGFAMRADPLVSSDLEQTIEECFQDMVAFTKRVVQLQ